MGLPTAFPDELLLGRLIRHLTLSGEQACAFTERVFGSSRVSLHPFLTTGITCIAKLSGEDAESMLNRQTLAPLFFFYLPKHAKQLKKELLDNNGARALRESQLPSFGSGRSIYLKWCSLCAKKDLQEFGVSYWHRTHQIPGVTSCYEHSVRFFHVELQRRQRLIEGLLPECKSEPLRASSVERDVSMFSQHLVKLLDQGIPNIELTSIYRKRLDDLGFVTSGGTIRRKGLMRCFTSAVA